MGLVYDEPRGKNVAVIEAPPQVDTKMLLDTATCSCSWRVMFQKGKVLTCTCSSERVLRDEPACCAKSNRRSQSSDDSKEKLILGLVGFSLVDPVSLPDVAQGKLRNS